MAYVRSSEFQSVRSNRIHHGLTTFNNAVLGRRSRDRSATATSAIRIQSQAWQAKSVIFVEFACSSNHPRAPLNPVHRSESGTRCASVHSYTILIASPTVCRPIMEGVLGLRCREEVHRLKTRRQSCHNRLWFRPGQINRSEGV